MGAGISNASFATQPTVLNMPIGLKGKTMIYAGASGSGGNIPIHTTTAGKTFYLVSVCLALQSTAIDTVGYLHVGSQANKFAYIATGSATGHAEIAFSFSQPIPIPSLTSVELLIQS